MSVADLNHDRADEDRDVDVIEWAGGPFVHFLDDRLFNGLDLLSFSATYAIPTRVTLSGPGVASRDVSMR